MSSTAGSDAGSISVICGPTAAGKSAIALALAARDDVLIISADSRQIYRGFDVGTAKPTPAEQEIVPHRGIDVIGPGQRYSAARWASSARGWIDEARTLGRHPIIVGGTGFYLRSLVEPLFESPALDPERRQGLERYLGELTTGELGRWCRQLDPARAHLGRAQLVRAVETALLAGRRISDLHRERARAPDFSPRYLLVDPGPRLAGRIARRIDAMFERGWVDEVRRLTSTVAASAPAWNASGYEAVRAFVLGTITESAARERVLIDTRQYAKRQRTWFRHQLANDAVTRVDPEQADADAVVRTWWDARERL